MNKREHDLRMCFDQEYREKHEFIQGWVDKHVDPWHKTFRKNFGPVLLPSWFMFLHSKNFFTLTPMLGLLLGCFYFQFERRKNSRRIAEAVWNDFPDLRSKY